MTTQQMLRTSHGMRVVNKPMRPRHPQDYYPTPLELCVEALRTAHFCTPLRKRMTILDPGCGTGVWGQAARIVWPDCWLVGIDIDPDRLALAEDTGVYGELIQSRFSAVTMVPSFDLVIGNPPYSEAEMFIKRAVGMLSDRARPGSVLFLLRLAFAESQRRYQQMYSNGLKPFRIASLVERPSFTGDGKTDATAYALFEWCPKLNDNLTEFEWLSWRNKEQ